MKMIITLLALLLPGPVLTDLNAQQAILPASGNASGTAGTVSYSIGQVAYHIDNGPDGTITQGVQQPFEIYDITGIEEGDTALRCLIYPNPTSSSVKLKIENPKLKNLSFQLYDKNGVLLKNCKIESPEQSIPMEDLAAASYFLIISDQNKTLKTYKIIKK